MQATEKRPMRICVVGAGIVGLSTAVRLVEESGSWKLGRDVLVTLLADRFSPFTTSDGSGGFWEPYCLGNTPVSLIRKWSLATWEYMKHMASSPDLAASVGAQFVSGYSLSDQDTNEDLFYKDIVLGFRKLTTRELEQFPFARSGSFFTSLQLNVKLYLPWLMHRFLQAGGKVQHQTVHTLQDVADNYDAVAICCGPRAGLLTSDSRTMPVRGQVRRVRAPWIKHFYIYETSKGDCSYVLPLGDEVVVGGVCQTGQWSEQVDVSDSRDIWHRATQRFPLLKKSELVSEWAGLRPGRDMVRLEEDQCINSSGQFVPVVHNYGHGGAGVTLHWGCALDCTRKLHGLLHASANASRL